MKAFRLTSHIADYLYTAATNARLMLSGSVLAMAQTLYLSGRLRDGEITTSATEGVLALAGAMLERVKITSAGAVDVGIHGFTSGVSMCGYGTHVIDNVVVEGRCCRTPAC